MSQRLGAVPLSHFPCVFLPPCCSTGICEAAGSNWPAGKITWKAEASCSCQGTCGQEEAAGVAAARAAQISSSLEKILIYSSPKPCKFRNRELFKQVNTLSAGVVDVAQKLQLGQLLPWRIHAAKISLHGDPHQGLPSSRSSPFPLQEFPQQVIPTNRSAQRLIGNWIS